MITFLPFADYLKSAESLDPKRLGKQRVENLTIYTALTVEGAGWSHHPAVKMWRCYERSLVEYAVAICMAWSARGYEDNTYFKWVPRQTKEPIIEPWWLGIEDFHRSQRSMLIQKNPQWYRDKLGWNEPVLDYWWPDMHSIGR